MPTGFWRDVSALSLEELSETYVAAALKAHELEGTEGFPGDYDNDLVLASAGRELRARGQAGAEVLLDLLQHEHPEVRLSAAVDAANLAPERVDAVLAELTAVAGWVGFYAAKIRTQRPCAVAPSSV